MINAFGYPAEYSGDVSTPEKRAALMSELWVKDAAKELISVWPKGTLALSEGAAPYKLLENELHQRNLILDEVDDVSCRPDFMLPIYPWDLRPRKNPANPWQGWIKTYELDAAYPVDAETPPAFIVQAEDDFCEVATAAGLSVALTKAGVANQVNLYSDGGHGYGRRILGHATDIWSHYAALWLAKFLE